MTCSISPLREMTALVNPQQHPALSPWSSECLQASLHECGALELNGVFRLLVHLENMRLLLGLITCDSLFEAVYRQMLITVR